MGWRRKVKEFVCPFCNADFDKKRQMKAHIKDKHGVPIEVIEDSSGKINESVEGCYKFV